MSTGFGLQYMITTNIRASLMLQTDMMAQSAMNQLRKEVLVDTDIAYAPLGTTGASYHELPSYFPVNRATRNGIPFLYCPYSTLSAVSNEAVVTVNASASYNVDVINSSTTNNRDYVSGSDSPSVLNLLAAIIAPSYDGAQPNCADISLNSSGIFVLSGASTEMGKVYALTAYDVVGTTDSNTTVLNDPSSITITDALNDVALSPTENFTFVLSSTDPYEISGDSELEGSSYSDRQFMVLRGSDASNPAVLNSSSNANLRFENMQLVIENVIFSRNISLEFVDSDVIMRNVITGPVAADSSDIIIEDVSMLGDTRGISALQLSLSTLRVKSGALEVSSTQNPVFLIQESTAQFTEGDLNMVLNSGVIGVQIENGAFIMRDTDFNYQNEESAAQALIYNDDASRVFLENVDVAGSGNIQYGIYTEGRSVLDNTNVMFNSDVIYGFYMNEGAEASFDSAVLGLSGSKMSVGLFDNGSDITKGSITTYATLCEDGDGFNRVVSADVSDSVVSKVNGDFSIIVSEVTKTIDVDLNDQFNKLSNTCL
jgi:hypothetical protein